MVHDRRHQALRALAQQLETDRFLGLREVPLVLGTLSKTPASRAKATARTATHARGAEESLSELDLEQVSNCRKCSLCQTRTKTVFGVGSASARVVFVGEAPGFHEDQQGIPFVGKAGDLLTKMIIAMGLSRETVYICNVLKCRPPSNRDPAPDEIAACSPYLIEQLSTIQPEVIVALGAPAARTLMNTSESIGRLRGTFRDFYVSGRHLEGVPTPLMATYHPAYLLRSPGEKRKTWADLQMVMEKLGLPVQKP